ncbi:IS701 family transposase [Deferrisoma sp.]
MNPQHLNRLIAELCAAITFLAKVVPKRSVRTWVELLFGAMMTHGGFVTHAYLAVRPGRHWTTYFKWLQNGRWSWVALGLQTARLALRLCPTGRLYLPLDDTVVFRSSRRAPEATFHHQHGTKPNRPRFALGQNWVTLALALERGSRTFAVPILSRLVRTTGNAGKLVAAKTLLRTGRSLFAPYRAVVLLDCWYMRRSLIQCAQTLGYHVLGQVRRDTALHLPPEPRPPGRRGRPRKYGAKLTADRVLQLPLAQIRVVVYGARHIAHYRSEVVLARFLGGQRVRAVWVTLERETGGTRSAQRLLLSTDLTLSPEEILRAYSRRWAIEDLFNQLKNRWGWKETWQQTRQVLHRWVQILSTGYALPQVITYQGLLDPRDVRFLYPWRYQQPPTAGMVRDLIARVFGHVDLRALWDAKGQKFVVPEWANPPRDPPDRSNAA